MIINVEERFFRKTRKRTVYVCECDVCHVQFELTPGRIKRNQRYQICGRACQNKAQRKGGLLDELKKEICLANWGVDNIAKSDHYKKTATNTIITRYGSIDAFNQIIHEKRTQTNLLKYGVENALQRPEIIAKQKATMIAKGSKRFQSRLERQVGELLRSTFKDVQTQRWVNGSPIDFYLPEHDLYIQVDGEFYHGLTERARQYAFVKVNYDRDRAQDAWFQANGLKLLRLSEATCKTLTPTSLMQLL